MNEKQAREVAELLSTLDDLMALKSALTEKGCEFYMCAQDREECLNADMTMPAECGTAVVDGFIKGMKAKLAEYGVQMEAANE